MRILLALILLVLAGAACSSANSAPPKSAPPPSTRSMTGSPVPASSTPVSPPPAGGVTARWQPDMNWKHAHPVATHGSATLARTLHHDIAVAKPFPRGRYSCPMDSGVAADLRLRDAAGEVLAVVHLTGCPVVTWPGHRARVVPSALRHDLATIAPKRWRRYLR